MRLQADVRAPRGRERYLSNADGTNRAGQRRKPIERRRISRPGDSTAQPARKAGCSPVERIIQARLPSPPVEQWNRHFSRSRDRHPETRGRAIPTDPLCLVRAVSPRLVHRFQYRHHFSRAPIDLCRHRKVSTRARNEAAHSAAPQYSVCSVDGSLRKKGVSDTKEPARDPYSPPPSV